MKSSGQRQVKLPDGEIYYMKRTNRAR